MMTTTTPQQSLEPDEAARLTSLLIRSDEDALAFFSQRTGAAADVPPEAIAWWAAFLRRVATKLQRSDVAGLDALRAAIERTESDVTEAAASPPATPPPVEQGTAAVDLSALGRAALPFRKGRFSPPPSEVHHEATAEASGGGATEPLDLSRVNRGPALPFKPPLPLEVFASLRARFERVTDAATREYTLSQSGIDEATYASATAYFESAFARDASLKGQFEELLAQWRAYLGRA